MQVFYGFFLFPTYKGKAILTNSRFFVQLSFQLKMVDLLIG